MTLNNHHAVIDNDFLDHLSTTRIRGLTDAQHLELFKTFFDALSIIPIVHPLVLQYEILADKDSIRPFFENNIVHPVSKDDILQNDPERALFYEVTVKDLYQKLTNELFPCEITDIWTDWIRGYSLGEVHSVVMCLLCNCTIFLSDDGDSKELQRIIETQSLGKVEVLNRAEVISKLPDGTFNKKTRSALTHKL
ncbi:MAG: hypothetical protein R3Y06_09930 [Faecalibacterium sp.]